MGQSITEWSEVALNSFSALGQKFMSFIPALLGAVLLLIIGIIMAVLLRKAVIKALNAVDFDSLPARVFGERFSKSGVNDLKPTKLAGRVVYWIILLVFLVTIAETLGWSVVSEKTGELIGYIPQLFSAVLIFVIGYYIAGFVSKVLEAGFGTMSMDSGRLISKAAFFIILVFVTITALDQAGVDTTLISANLSIIIAGVVVAFSVSFAWSVKGILQSILAFHYSRHLFEVGQSIRIGEVEGVITKLDHIHLVIRSGNEDVIIPTRELSEKQVRVIKNAPQAEAEEP